MEKYTKLIKAYTRGSKEDPKKLLLVELCVPKKKQMCWFRNSVITCYGQICYEDVHSGPPLPRQKDEDQHCRVADDYEEKQKTQEDQLFRLKNKK